MLRLSGIAARDWRAFSRLFGPLLSASALALVAYGLSAKLDYAQLARTVARIDVGWLVLALVVMTAQTAVAGLRLRLVATDVTGDAPQYRKCAAVHWLTLFISHGAPVAAIGEVARLAVLSSMLRLSLGNAFRVFLHDRLWGLFGMALLGSGALLFQVLAPGEPHAITLQAVAWLGVIVGLVLLFLVRKVLPFVPWGWFRHLLGIASGYFDAWRSPLGLLLQTLCAVAYIGLAALALWILALGLDLHARLAHALMFAPIIIFAMSLPFFYAGWGAREAVVVATLGQSADVGPVGALAVSIGYGLVYMLISLPGAVVWMLNPEKVLPATKSARVREV